MPTLLINTTQRDGTIPQCTQPQPVIFVGGHSIAWTVSSLEASDFNKVVIAFDRPVLEPIIHHLVEFIGKLLRRILELCPMMHDGLIAFHLFVANDTPAAWSTLDSHLTPLQAEKICTTFYLSNLLARAMACWCFHVKEIIQFEISASNVGQQYLILSLC